MSLGKASPSAQAVAVEALSMVSILISLPPLALHWKNRNFPAISLICWFLTMNVFNIVNGFIWPTDDLENWWDGAGLCDIEVKVFIGSYVGIPGCVMCIFRGLACVLDTRRAILVLTKRQRWQNRAVELSFCVIIPFIASVLHLAYQRGRYYIFGISGCVSGIDENWVSLALGYIWPLIICLFATYYCGLVLYRLYRYRSQFGDIIRSSNSGSSKSRFLRLFFLSFIMLLALLPVESYVVYENIVLGLPWHAYSWPNLRASWSEITMVPSNGEVFYDRWICISAGFMLFIFFGCGRDATRMYRSALRLVGLDCCLGAVGTSSTGTFRPNASGSTGSRAQLLLHGSKNHGEIHTVTGSTSTTSTHNINKDVEKGIHSSRNTKNPSRPRWLKSPFSWLSRSTCEGRLPTPRLAAPSNTVSTSAWAGSSQSRSSIGLDTMPSPTDFIRVKQVIRQESEMQV